MKYQDGEIVFDTHLEALNRGLAQWGVESELSVSPQTPPAMGVEVSPGVAKLNQTEFSFAAATPVSISPADPDYPRKDTVVLDHTGAIRAIKGTPAPAEPAGKAGIFTYKPKPPDLPDVAIPLAEIWIGAGATKIEADDITDRRHIVKHYITAQDLASNIDASGKGFNADKVDGKHAADFMPTVPGAKGDMIYHDGAKWATLYRPTTKKWLRHPGGATPPVWDDLPPVYADIKTLAYVGTGKTVTQTSETLQDSASPADPYTGLQPQTLIYEVSNPPGSTVWLYARALLRYDDLTTDLIHSVTLGEGSAEAYDFPTQYIAGKFTTLKKITQVQLTAWVSATPAVGYEPSVTLKKVAGYQY